MRLSTKLVMLLALGAWGCAPSMEEIQAEFAETVEEASECAEDDDCVVVFPGCPLGCYVAVNEASAVAVQTRAEELIDDYERGGQGCVYDCIEHEPPRCDAGRCTVEPAGI